MVLICGATVHIRFRHFDLSLDPLFHGMISMPGNLRDDLTALKRLLAQMQSKVVHLEEESALLHQRFFGRKSEQTVDPAETHSQVTAQNALGKAISYLASNWDKLVCTPKPVIFRSTTTWQSVRSGPS